MTKPTISIKPDVPGDIEILKALARHSMLIPTDLVAATGRSYRTVIRRCQRLKDHGFIRVCDTQNENKRTWLSHPKALQLAPKGIGKLMDIGYPIRTPQPSKHFIHTLTENQLALSFEIGAGDRLITFDEILTSDSTPDSIKKSGDHSIPVKFHFKGKDYDYKLTPDGRPFGLTYPNEVYHFYCLEVDMGTEPVRTANRDRQTIETKLAAYLNVFENRLHESHLGFPDLTLLLTTISPTRLQDILNIWASMTTQFRNRVAGKIFPSILGDQQAHGSAVTVPWHLPDGKTLHLGEY